MPRLPAAAVVVAAVRTRATAGVEIAGDHDPDRLHPARHVAHGVEAALGDHVVFGMPLLAPRLIVGGIFDAEELEPFVVLVIAARHGSEVVAAAAGEARARRRPVAIGVAPATAAPARGRIGPGIGRRPSAGFVASATPAAPATALALVGAAGGLAALRLSRLLRAAVARRQWFIVVGVARLSAGDSVATRLAGRRTTSATPAAAPPPAPAGAPLVVERPFGLFAARSPPLVDEVVERFGSKIPVVRHGVIAEACRCGRVLAPTTTATAAAAPSATAPRASFSTRLGTVVALLGAFAPSRRGGLVRGARLTAHRRLRCRPPNLCRRARLDRRARLGVTARGRSVRLTGGREAEAGVEVLPSLGRARCGRARRRRAGFLAGLLRGALWRRRRRLTARRGAQRIGKRGPGIFFVRHGNSVDG